MNFDWFINFNEAYIQHLNWFKSNHISLLLIMGNGVEDKRLTRRFRFIAAWVIDDSFKEMLKGNWRKDCSWPVTISWLTDRIKEWNKDIFGNINKRKRIIINRLNGIDRANLEGTNPYLNHLQEILWKDYEKTPTGENFMMS